jgi:multicomponent Na+:H+ antiporter subunit B
MYAGVGIYSLLMGYEFLDHSALNPSNPGGAEPWGMTLVEYGVGMTVAAVMITICNEITEGTAPDEKEPE